MSRHEKRYRYEEITPGVEWPTHHSAIIYKPGKNMMSEGRGHIHIYAMSSYPHNGRILPLVFAERELD